MPVRWKREDQPQHPATQYLAWMNSFEGDLDEEYVRRVVAGYCGLISVIDEQVGEVLKALEKFDLKYSTRILYTSDHGEAAGHRGIFGKPTIMNMHLGCHC